MPHPRWTPLAIALAALACTPPVETPPPVTPDAGTPPPLLPGPYTTSSTAPRARVLAAIVPAPSTGRTSPLGAQVQALEYALKEVQLCGGLTVTADGFTNPQFCARAWQAPGHPVLEASPSVGDLATFARSADARLSFLDLLDPRARLSLRGRFSVGEDSPLLFNWGYVEWHPVARLSATAEVDDTRLATKDGITAEAQGRWTTTSAESFESSGEPAIATVPLTTTRNWFKLATPLRIEPTDVKNGRGLRVDLVFDPEDLVLARKSGSEAALVDANGAGFIVPPLEITAVPMGSEDVLWRETWTAPIPGSDATLKLSLYGRQSDATRRVLGLSAREVSWTAATGNSTLRSRIVAINPVSDGWTLQELANVSVVRRFLRQANPAPGDTARAEIRCTADDERPAPRGFVVEGCAPGEWRSVTFTAH